MKAVGRALAALRRRLPAGGKAARAADATAGAALGLAFVWAAALKIRDPAGTLLAVASYRVLPDTLAPWAALFLPWLELWAGLACAVGPSAYRRAGALALSALLVLFMSATALALARGLDFECGCFGTGGGRPGAAFFLRDAGLLLLGLEVAFHRRIFGSPAGTALPPEPGAPA